MIGNSEAPEFSNEKGKSIISKSAAKGPLPGATDKVYDLIDIVHEFPDKIHELSDTVEELEPLRKEEPQELLIIDGRGYKEGRQPEEKIHDLVDITEEKRTPDQPQVLPEDVMRKAIVETVERMTREMIPGIAERIIREEIEKLKREAEEEIQ